MCHWTVSLYPIYTIPDEFGTGLKLVLFRLFARKFVLLGGLKFVTDKFQPSSKTGSLSPTSFRINTFDIFSIISLTHI
jgi:hypothetical protein